MHQALVASLRRAVSRLELREKKTEWGDYYEATNYSDGGMTAKEELVDHFLTKYASDSRRIHDLGANVGRFSQIAARHADVVIAHDIDELAVDRHYRKLKQTCENILPLILDVTNPTPSIGWRLRERDSFVDRCDDDLVMALAVIHHIVIGNNVPLESAAAFFSDIASKLIIEFVPKEDSQVQRLLATREDIFKDYSADKFEQAFSSYFRIVETSAIRDTERSLYIMERLNS